MRQGGARKPLSAEPGAALQASLGGGGRWKIKRLHQAGPRTEASSGTESTPKLTSPIWQAGTILDTSSIYALNPQDKALFLLSTGCVLRKGLSPILPPPLCQPTFQIRGRAYTRNTHKARPGQARRVTHSDASTPPTCHPCSV